MLSLWATHQIALGRVDREVLVREIPVRLPCGEVDERAIDVDRPQVLVAD